jgi:Superinfection immunity protein
VLAGSAGLPALYILPRVIAAIRGVPGLGWIILINLLPTGVGWLAAFIAAVALPRRAAPQITRVNSQG